MVYTFIIVFDYTNPPHSDTYLRGMVNPSCMPTETGAEVHRPLATVVIGLHSILHRVDSAGIAGTVPADPRARQCKQGCGRLNREKPTLLLTLR